MGNKKTKPEVTTEKKNDVVNETSEYVSNIANRIFFEFDPKEDRDSQIELMLEDKEKTGTKVVINILPTNGEYELGDYKFNPNLSTAYVAGIFAIENNRLNTQAVINGVTKLVRSMSKDCDIVHGDILIITKNLDNVKNHADVNSLYVYVEAGLLYASVSFDGIIMQEVYKNPDDLIINTTAPRDDDKDEKKKKKDKKKKKKRLI